MASLERARVQGTLLLCGALALSIQACSSAPSGSSGPQQTGVQPPSTVGPVMGAAGSGVVPVGPVGGGTSVTPPVGGSTAPMTNTGMTMPPPAMGGSGGSSSTDPGTGENPNPTPTGSSDWTVMGYDVGSTYFNSAETKLTKDNAASLEVAYTVDMGGPVYGAPLQIGDRIYASGPGSVKALNAADGMQLWSTPVSSTASMGYSDGKLYINSRAQLVALDAADGKMLWSKPQNTSETADGSSSPLPVGDLVLVGGSNGAIELGGGSFRGFLSALNKMTGEIAWSTFTVPETANGASIWSSPSADPQAGLAYAGTGNNYGAPATDSSDSIIAFDLKGGAIKWKAQRVTNDTFGGGLGGVGPDSDFGANPVLYDTMIDGVMTKVASAGAKGGTIGAVRRDTGEKLWERSVCTGTADGSSGIFVNSTWTGKYMLFACNQGGPATLYAVDGATGDMVWMRQLTGQVWGRMSASPGLGFVGTGTNLEVFDVDTGMVIKSFPSKGGTVAGTITISNGRVAFGEGFQWSSGRPGSTLTVLAVK